MTMPARTVCSCCQSIDKRDTGGFAANRVYIYMFCYRISA